MCTHMQVARKKREWLTGKRALPGRTRAPSERSVVREVNPCAPGLAAMPAAGPRGNLLFKFGALDCIGGCVEHGANVPQVLLRAAFAVIFELAHDDVLGMPNDEHLAFHFQLPRPRQSPGVQ